MAKTYDMDGSVSNSISDRQEKKKKSTLWDSMKKIKPTLKNRTKEKNKRIQDILKGI